jgi:tagatose 6-phosphate kinase
MILCICASPALDVTYRVDRLTVGATNRVREVGQRPGGKAINVARLLHLLGNSVQLLTTAGGDTGADLAAGLRRVGIEHDLVPTKAATRRTVAVVDETTGDATMLNEPAVVEDWSAFVTRAAALIPRAEVVVISGALPAGAPTDGFAELTAIARRHDRPVVLDTSGAALAASLDAGPSIIKPNAEELRGCAAADDPMAAARSVAERWQVAVVASLGPDGLIAVDGDAAWQARPARVVSGNATGAGDAVVAGLARGLAAGDALGSVLAECVALASAAVLAPVAGELEPQDYYRERAGVIVQCVDQVRR